jgi:serine/threonine protein kinase
MYELGTELGCGGYGFVMTARHRADGNEVAVKFIIQSKVPKDAWIDHEEIGRIPAEVLLLSFVEHDNIVRCLDVFEDGLYFYLVSQTQEIRASL